MLMSYYIFVISIFVGTLNNISDPQLLIFNITYQGWGQIQIQIHFS